MENRKLHICICVPNLRERLAIRWGKSLYFRLPSGLFSASSVGNNRAACNDDRKMNCKGLLSNAIVANGANTRRADEARRSTAVRYNTF